jgi:protein-S-isoprenylcysteine O-methyltransferase Ste14
MQTWPIRIGKFLFKYRSFTPLPLILLTLIIFKPLSPAPFFSIAGLLLALIGETIRIICVGCSGSGTSGRESFLKADSLNTSGLYSLARNPLYWGNIFIFSGLLIAFAQPLALAGFIFFLVGQYQFIIRIEETFLRERYGSGYHEYCRQVRRWLPRFRNFSLPEKPFDCKKVFFKENDSVFNLLFIYLLILAYKEYLFSGKIRHAKFWLAGAVVLILFYAFLKILKKTTRPSVKNS